MSAYNILKAETKCPRCEAFSDQQIDLYFGYRSEMLEFKIGDKYVWRNGKEVQNGGRPKDGNLDGEGYVECESCHKDFFVKVLVRNDEIKDVILDLEKKGYIK